MSALSLAVEAPYLSVTPGYRPTGIDGLVARDSAAPVRRCAPVPSVGNADLIEAHTAAGTPAARTARPAAQCVPQPPAGLAKRR